MQFLKGKGRIGKGFGREKLGVLWGGRRVIYLEIFGGLGVHGFWGFGYVIYLLKDYYDYVFY